MRPIATMKAATAATDSPAICAGVMVFGPGGVPATIGTAVGVLVADNEEVVDDTKGFELIMIELEVIDEARVDVVNVVDVCFVVVVCEDAIVATTVMAVCVGRTASLCPKQMLYDEDALSIVGHDEYMHPRATSPSDSPLML